MASEPRTTKSDALETGTVKAWAPSGVVAYVLGRVDDRGEVEEPYWLDVDSEVDHQRERGLQVAECDRRGEAVFTGTPTDMAIAQLQSTVHVLREELHAVKARLTGAGAVLADGRPDRRFEQVDDARRMAAGHLLTLLALPDRRPGASEAAHVTALDAPLREVLAILQDDGS